MGRGCGGGGEWAMGRGCGGGGQWVWGRGCGGGGEWVWGRGVGEGVSGCGEEGGWTGAFFIYGVLGAIIGTLHGEFTVK